jgi:hypothetical protein
LKKLESKKQKLPTKIIFDEQLNRKQSRHPELVEGLVPKIGKSFDKLRMPELII